MDIGNEEKFLDADPVPGAGKMTATPNVSYSFEETALAT